MEGDAVMGVPFPEARGQERAAYQVAFCPYQRPFRRPLQTHHGLWRLREGIWVYLRDCQGRVGVGEIAPLPWFGTETQEAALDVCRSLGQTVTLAQIAQIPPDLPCCQFGFGCALEQLLGRLPQSSPSLASASICALLSAGASALKQWQPLWEQGYRTFKWKIGVTDSETELPIFEQLLAQLPQSARLRLDANGGLTQTCAERWLAVCDAQRSASRAAVEYLEQPLPAADGPALLALARTFQTPLALDEAITTGRDWEKWLAWGWPGLFVLKPALMGFPQQIRDRAKGLTSALVFSSVFETRVGRSAALHLALELGHPQLALGFGVDHWLAESPRVSINSSIFS